MILEVGQRAAEGIAYARRPMSAASSADRCCSSVSLACAAVASMIASASLSRPKHGSQFSASSSVSEILHTDGVTRDRRVFNLALELRGGLQTTAFAKSN